MKPITVDNGTDAIKMINRNLPDLIILDAMLPGKHGFEICKEIKESETLSSIPVLIISAIYKGWQFEKDIINIYKANKFLEKPFRISALMDTIKELIEVKKEISIPDEDQKLDQILSLSAKLINKGDFGNAQKILEHAVKVAPFYYKFRYLLGYTYLVQNNNYLAISELETAVDMNRKFFPAIKELAVLYEKMGFRNKAIEKWQIAIEATEDKSVKERIKKHLIDLVSTI
jgi:response regulator RpfG family c-di-GMP phosphodiesterase